MHLTPARELEKPNPLLPLRGVLAAILSALMVLLGLTLPTAALADDAGAVTLTVDYGAETFDGTTVVTPGTSYTATLRYDASKIVPGSTTKIVVPEGVAFPSAVPGGNSVVESIAFDDDGNMLVTFKQDPDTSIAQGRLSFAFTFEAPVQGSGERPVTWTVGGVDVTKNLIIKKPGDTFQPALNEQHTKSAGVSNLNGHVSRSSDGVVTLNPAVSGTEIPYTVVIDSSAARVASFSDTLSDYLSFIPGSFAATLTTWDSNGLNQVTAPFTLPEAEISSQTATVADLDLPANSRLTLTYRAAVASGQVAALQQELQSRADAVDPERGGSYAVQLPNEATVGTTTKTASVSIGGSVAAAPSPGLGGSISKTSNLNARTPIALNEDGELAAPVDVTYTISMSLRPWAGFAGTRHELTRNVVINDTLIPAIEWASGDFLKVTSGNMTLVKAASNVSDADFAGDAYVGNYRISADGKRIDINVGRDTTQVYTFTAQAQITGIEGLPLESAANTPPQAESVYRVMNRAYYQYSDTLTPQFSTRNDTLLLPKAPGSEVDDPAVFDKSVGELKQMTKGEAYWVPFTFGVAANAVPDLRDARIIDSVNDEVFDTSDLGAIAATITGTYAGAGTLGASDFDLTMQQGELVITPSATFGSNLPAQQRPTADQALTQRLTLALELPTYTVEGKQTLDVSNSARLEASDTETYIWMSEARSSATSYGDELELTKLLYTQDGEWSSALRAELDENGNLKQQEFIYRVVLTPHGDFPDITDITDVLPEGTELLGFVSDADLGTGRVTSTSTINIGANMQATADIADRTVTVSQRPGTTIPPGSQGIVNFKIRIDKFTEDISIVNRIGAATATITPSRGFPLVIHKVDSAREDVTITDRNARFTVTGPNDEVITDEAYVVNGQLMVEGDDGTDRGIVIPVDPQDPNAVPAGAYTVTEQIAPAGYVRSTAEVVTTLRADGSATPVTFYNTPESLFALGDLVWIDQNRDGLQSPGELPLESVTVELRDAATGDVVATTTTDENGRYLFDLLPEGAYTVRFVLTEEQSQRYTFTQPTENSVATDSDATLVAGADRVTGETGVITLNSQNTQLTADSAYPFGSVQALNGIDPTWDAGVVEKTYAIGDYVWVDANRAGDQSAPEQALADVTVELFAENGDPAVDINGIAVAAVVTGADGRYLFDNLPAGNYQVRFTLTAEQSQNYAFTTPDSTVTNDPAVSPDQVDSDALVSDDERVGYTIVVTLDPTNTQLTKVYDRVLTATEGVDPTWDAGIVLRSVSVGDLVWIDENRDGLQDANEPGIAGVVLVITGPDGNPVVDVNGQPVLPVTTDDQGSYVFAGLPVLADGQSYTVSIDREASAGALVGFSPTVSNTGDREGDSSEWSAQSQGLTAHAQSDLTLDFGFVRDVPPAPNTDENNGVDGNNTPGEPVDGGLSETGANSNWLRVGGVLALLLIGAGVFFVLRGLRLKSRNS